MKLLLVTLLTTMMCVTNIFAEASQQFYLQIVLNDGTDVSYPPDTGFVLQDANENSILNPSELIALKTFQVSEFTTLFVFPKYKNTPDVFEINQGTLFMKPVNYAHLSESKPTKTNFDHANYSSNGVTLKQSRYFSYSEEFGYAASFEFSNDVIVYFRDGKVEAWQNGKSLKIDGNYRVFTSEGIIKLSYDTATKEMWWVFEKMSK